MVLIVSLLAFAICLCYVTHAVVFQAVYLANIHGDGVQHYRYAINLLDHSVFSSDLPPQGQPTPDNFRAPGYPVFLATLLCGFKAWTYWYAAAVTCQALLGAVTVTLWMAVARDWMSLPYTLSAGLVMAA
jgi:hypothetical protein